MKKNIIIGIAGGTGSGKTTLADRIIDELNEPNIVIIKQDAYYKSHQELSFDERKDINFDHPDAFDTKLLIKHLKNLKDNVPIHMPQYDFTTHLRERETIPVSPQKVTIVEGILIFENKEVRNLLDIKIFVDTDSDVRILRRIKRDIQERGRTFESVYSQYMKTVRPMHIEFVEPSKKFADIIVPEGGMNIIAIDMIVSKIQHILQESENS
ncbi:MAG TPA: uridine kinase [Candidatus Cloacimonetes bacterium]|nr:uridine kinase [Candidatus Cloacimonadota bacterium]HEX38163.1 uridine kinase [Candidatus Cloacimonadota bacterium]